jgi:hypothetical protein
VFSRLDLRNSVFQDSITILSCLGNFLKQLIQQKFEFCKHNEVKGILIPYIFEEETKFLDSDTMSILNVIM